MHVLNTAPSFLLTGTDFACMRSTRRLHVSSQVQTSWLRNFHGSMELSFVNYGLADARALPPGTARLSAERATLMPQQLLVNSYAYHIRQSQAPKSTLLSPSSSPRQRRSMLTMARGSSSDGFTPTLTTARPASPQVKAADAESFQRKRDAGSTTGEYELVVHGCERGATDEP